MPTLSVCLIVRNEERHLPRCLDSIRDLADEIVVVDTGSTDATVEIASAAGVRLFHLAWQDDFSHAKNHAIEQATGDWVLSIDADETIALRDHRLVRDALSRARADAFVVAQRHYLAADTTLIGWQAGSGGYDEGEPYAGFIDVDCRRLFRNVPRLRFRNRVHEALVSIDPERPMTAARGDWVIHHFGKLGGRDLLRAKGETYLRIGLKKAEDEPRNPQAHYELAVQYAELGNPAEAIAWFTRTLELAPGFRDAQLRLGLSLAEHKEYRQALAALRVAARTLPAQAADIALAEGNVHRALGDDQAAERAFKRAIVANGGLVAASFNLALLLRRQHRYDEALSFLDAALTHSPAHSELRLLRGRMRADRGDDHGALDDLDSLQDHRAQRLRARLLLKQRRFDDAANALGSLDTTGDAELLMLAGAAALGRGDLDTAVTHLGGSLAVHETSEAALNLSMALEARGDADGALAAAADALRLSPGAPPASGGAARRGPSPALTRVAHLAADRFRTRASNDPALTIVFHQPFSVPFDGDTPRTRGLGGTESAIVYLAEALARRGHRCIVLNNCERPSRVRGVEYGRWETLAARCVSDRPDVVVGVRFWETIGRARLAPLQILWTGDAFDQPFLEGLDDPVARREIDLFMLQSGWHVETFHARHELPLSQIVTTRLGTAASIAEPPIVGNTAPRARRMAYASTPFRGLDVLLDLFPRIRDRCPDATLEVFSSMQVYGVAAEDDRRQFDAIYRKADQPGVTLVGSLPQMELATRLQQARLLAYPNHYAETFCIAAAEAQAAGCAVVTSALGALPETVGDAGVCIPGDPKSRPYQQAFVDACVELLTDDERWGQYSRQALEQASASYAWPSIAAHWEETCRAALSVESPDVARIAVHVTAGRGALARRMLQRTPKPGDVPSDAWRELESFVAWQAGDGPMPSPHRLQRLGLFFPSLRKGGAIEAALREVRTAA